MTNHWDERYKSSDYAYGKEPNQFIKKTLLELNIKGKALFPAEGEGRNAVFAAKQGIEVTAFDPSIEGKKKADKLASENNVSINYLTGSYDSLDFSANYFDAVVLNFAHLPPNQSANFHQRCVSLLKKGGFLILEGFSKEHFKLNTKDPKLGGPKNMDMLFSKEKLLNEFKGLEVIKLSVEEVVLSEGLFHNGLSSVIRFVGKK